MNIDKNIVKIMKYPILILSVIVLFFSLRSDLLFLTSFFSILSTITFYLFIKRNERISPLIILFLLYSYLNNVVGPLIKHFSNDQMINSYGFISNDSIFKLPLFYFIQILGIIIFQAIFNKKLDLTINPSTSLITKVNFILVISLLIISSSVFYRLPDWFLYLGYGFNNYISFAPFFIGCNFNTYKKKTLLILILLYIPAFILLSLINSRGLAIFPVLSFLVGFILYSSVRISIKRKLLLFSIIILPLYFIVSNIGRIGNDYIRAGEFNNELRIKNTILFFSGGLGVDFKTALQVSVTNRIFPIGGYTIIQKTPDLVPYKDFNLLEYLNIGIQSEPDKYKLIEYGFRINDSHSIGISLFGDFWMYGGWFSLLIGLFLFTVIIFLDLGLIYRINKFNKDLSYLLVFSQLNIFFYAQGKSLYSFLSAILTSYLIAIILRWIFTLKIFNSH